LKKKKKDRGTPTVFCFLKIAREQKIKIKREYSNKVNRIQEKDCGKTGKKKAGVYNYLTHLLFQN